MHRPRAMTQVRQGGLANASGNTHIPVTLGDLLRAMRARRNRTLEEVAAKIDVTTRTLSRWERGEIAPNLEQLHSVCHTLGASEKEMTLLSQGVAAVMGTDQSSPATLDELSAQFQAASSYPYPPEKAGLLELTYISLALRLQPLAWQDASARELLVRVYTMLANTYYLDLRYEKTLAFAERALQISEEASVASAYTVIALIRYIEARCDPQKDIELLDKWLGRITDIDLRAWMLDQQAERLARLGRRAEAEARSLRSLRLTADMKHEWVGRCRSRASLLSRWKRYDAAMELLTPLEETEKHAPTIALIWAKMHLARQEGEQAQRWLDEAATRLNRLAPQWENMAPCVRRQIEQTQKAIWKRQQA